MDAEASAVGRLMTALSSPSAPGRAPATALVFVAVVHTRDCVRFAAADVSRAALMAQVADYVRDRVDDELREDGVRRVRALLAVGAVDDAVEHYFARVGERWD